MNYEFLQVLGEIQTALAERGVKPRPDVNREAMPLDVRNLSDASFRYLRDFIIFRDYMNALEYIIQVIEYMKGENSVPSTQ